MVLRTAIGYPRLYVAFVAWSEPFCTMNIVLASPSVM